MPITGTALSMLDLFPVEVGGTTPRVLADSVRIAQRAEALGYVRYWVAEHHGMPAIATGAPEILIAHVLAKTTRLRVGSGGVMLPNHSALHVVETYRTLEALHPGRVDLGLGRATGTDPVTASALRRRPSEVNDQIAELLAFSEGNFPSDHPFATIRAMPDDVALPPIWMLGSTLGGAGIAAQLGIGFAFAGHFSLEHARPALQRYRQSFVPSRQYLQKPQAILALSVICAESNARAEALAGPLRLSYARLAQGDLRPFSTVEQARKHAWTAAEQAVLAPFAGNLVLGDRATVAAKLARLEEQLRPDELMISTGVADPDERLASYERLAT